MNFEETKIEEIISISEKVETKKTQQTVSIPTKIDTPKIKTQKEDTSKIDDLEPHPIKQARFKGGDIAFKEFVAKNLKYPVGIASCVEGTVYVRFMIDTDGSIMKDCVKVVKSLEKSFDEEAMRVVKLMPNWTPAMWYHKERVVQQRMRVPIQFKRNR